QVDLRRPKVSDSDNVVVDLLSPDPNCDTRNWQHLIGTPCVHQRQVDLRRPKVSDSDNVVVDLLSPDPNCDTRNWQ
ncbi:hypothetical protein, partial [Escherichia coli]|uniref:hypothetical protein n=1 Tax=Escherichia coli TaxID=562 RepID=UPI001596D040